jgi:hypothetical protein
MEEMRNNPAFAHFFKPRPAPPGTSPLLADLDDFDDDDDDDDPDDPDYHTSRPQDIPTITYIKKVGRGNKVQHKKFVVDEVPSSASSGSSGYTVYSEDESPSARQDQVGVGSTKTVSTMADLEERGEVLRRAAEVLREDPTLFPLNTYEQVADALEIAYDRTMKPCKIYHAAYLKEQMARRARLIEELKAIDSLIPPDPNNPFI